jgi:adenylate cyclase
VIALAAVAVGLALYVWNPEPLQRLELSTIDTRFSVRGSSDPDPRIVMIAVDDRTLRRFHAKRPVLPRGQYAPMLEHLRRDRPAVIALDVVFKGTGEARGDRELLDAIGATHDRLVLPFTEYSVVPKRRSDGTEDRTVVPELFGRPQALQATRVSTGFAGLPDDKDGGSRRADYQVVAGSFGTLEDPRDPRSKWIKKDVPMDTFAFAAANLMGGGHLSARVDDLPTAPRRDWGGESERTTWIDYRGPSGTVRRVSALDVIDGRMPAGAFRDKVVVIGVVARTTPDVHRTPLDSGMPGAEVQANALDTMLRGAPLRDASRLVDFLAIVLLACLAAAAALMRSVPAIAAAIVAVAVAFLIAAQLAFQSGWIVAMVVPLAALVAAAVGVAALGGARLARRRRARRPAAAD